MYLFFWLHVCHFPKKARPRYLPVLVPQVCPEKDWPHWKINSMYFYIYLHLLHALSIQASCTFGSLHYLFVPWNYWADIMDLRWKVQVEKRNLEVRSFDLAEARCRGCSMGKTWTWMPTRRFWYKDQCDSLACIWSQGSIMSTQLPQIWIRNQKTGSSSSSATRKLGGPGEIPLISGFNHVTSLALRRFFGVRTAARLGAWEESSFFSFLWDGFLLYFLGCPWTLGLK